MNRTVMLSSVVAVLAAVAFGLAIVHSQSGAGGHHGVHAMHGALPASADRGTTSMYAEREFDFELPGTVAALTPYFGPVKEHEWAPEWKPAFMHPLGGGQQAGAVFQVTSEWGTATWVMDHYEPQLGKVGYVIFVPATGVSRYDIALSQRDADTVHVHVWCSRTLLPNADHKYLAQFEQFFTSQGPEWQAAITGILSRAAAGKQAP